VNLKNELGKLEFYFERGKKTYQAYLDSGSIYLYALILRENNSKIVESLSCIYGYCPVNLQQDILELTHHIDVWSSHWQALHTELNPKSEDKFVFENSVNYPKSAEENIIKYYEALEQ
jgi:hypothetical protein